MGRPRFQVPDLPPDRPKVPLVAGLVRAFYARCGNEAGGVLHVVLDDGNLELCFVRSCLENAEACGDEEAAVIARLMLQMTSSQRSRVYRQGHRR